ncbi:MAG TPA: hypothetical protein ENG13_04175, partial [bacterium]|nr:hypothetical protein [bacterium]HEX68244.1 hypothetical protein [bacterium]
MEDLAGLLPGIGDLMTIKDILVAIYNGDYDKAVETAAQKKIEDKISDILGKASVILTAGKLEYYLINYYQKKLDQAVFEKMIEIYRSLSPGVKKKILAGDKDALYENVTLALGEDQGFFSHVLFTWASRKEQIENALIDFLRKEEKQKRAFERLRKRAQRIMNVRLYATCIFSFTDKETGDYEDVVLEIKKNGKKIGERTGSVLVFKVKRLREGEEYEFAYTPYRKRFFKAGSVKLTAQDIPLANKVMSMVYKKFSIELEPTQEYKEYLKKLEEERKKKEEEELRRLAEEKRREMEELAERDPWPKTVAYKEMLIREYEKNLEDLKKGRITFKAFEDAYQEIFYKKFYPKYGIAPQPTEEELLYLGSYEEYIEKMREMGKEPSSEDYFQKREEIEKKYEQIVEPRRKQWEEWKKAFAERHKDDLEELKRKKEEIMEKYDLNYKELDEKIEELLKDYVRKYNERMALLKELEKKYREAEEYERFEIAEKGYQLCEEIQDIIQVTQDSLSSVMDKWRENALEVLEGNVGILSMDTPFEFIEEAVAFYEQRIWNAPEERLRTVWVRKFGNFWGPPVSFLEERKGMASFWDLYGACWERLYENERNLYSLYNGIYPSQLYTWCRKNLPRIKKLQPNIEKLKRLESLKDQIVWWKKTHEDWEIYQLEKTMEEFIRLLDSVENILEPLKAEASFLEKVRRYYSLTAYQRYVVLKGEAKDLVDKFFSYRLALDDLPLYPPFVFDEIINKVRNETKDMVKLYLKEKKYFSKLAEAGAKYRKLESLSKNLENNWKSILEMDNYFKALKPESALLKEIKERALKFLSSLKPQLQKVLNEKLSYLQDFLKKVDEVKDRGSLGNLYADYVNKITPLFKEDFPYPLYQSIKEMVKKIGRKINEKFQEFERKEKEEELIAQISPLVKGLKEEKRKLEDSLQNLSPDRAMEMIEKFIMKTDHLIGKVENFLNKYTSSKVEKLMDELENLKEWADRFFEEIKEKSETERAVFKIKNLYHSFAYYYESKNLG